MRELEEKINGALKSREQRGIWRRVPSGTGSLIDFCSNDYLSLASNSQLRANFLKQLTNSEHILGSGGSRLLVDMPPHSALESRLATFFSAPTALLFNSGFDANAGFFSAVPQHGDVIIYDEYIHASVHDGMRSSRARSSTFAFEHNSLVSLEDCLQKVIEDRPEISTGKNSVFVAIEALYSMDGDFAPLREIVDLLEKILLHGNGHLVVDEAHSTGLYGKQGRGIVSMLGIEDRVTARLHTFGKALAGSGAVILTTRPIREYLVNYARPLIYTTALSHSSIINANCSFDVLESDLGIQLSERLIRSCTKFLHSLRTYLHSSSSGLLFLPETLWIPGTSDYGLVSPIIPLLTPHPRPLAAYLQKLGFLTRPITHPTVPKGLDRVRICLHAENALEDVDGLLAGIIAWAESQRPAKPARLLAKL
ncbi:PLP-dependent transferase [Hysterangium stoloniferum]|nr:PLP-dependent transferase [Hysterangium stoloniferum]